MVGQRVQKLHNSVESRLAALEFFSGCTRPLFAKSEDLIQQEKYDEAEKILLETDKRVSELEKYEHRTRQWKKEGVDITQLVTTGKR